MAHNLYRFYLYIVYIALLIFAAFAIGRLLNTLLAFTPLNGSGGGLPPSSDVVQSVVFAIVSLAIAGALAGLHYWLIRRDMQNDPNAANSAIRSFFLNIPEAIGIVLTVPFVGFFVFAQFISPHTSSVVGTASFALATLFLVTLLELERRRILVTQGVALAFQRLHFYGVQALLLLFLTFAWLAYSSPLVDALFFAGRNTQQGCLANGNNITYCPHYSVVFLLVTLLWFVVFWIGYGWLLRKDPSSLLRLILHGLSFAYGIGFLLSGLYQTFRLIFQVIFGSAPALKDVLGPGATYDFIAPLTLGLLVAGVYFLWLRVAARQGLIKRDVLALTEYAICAILAAGTFWWGCGSALYNLLQLWMPVPHSPVVQDWVATLALALTGIGYIPLDLYLRRRYALEAATTSGPRRGFVLALSGGGILALAIGAAVALYTWITALFGSPVTNWQQVAHGGLAAFLVGVILVAIYLGAALRERLLSGLFRRRTSVASTSPSAATGAVQPSDARGRDAQPAEERAVIPTDGTTARSSDEKTEATANATAGQSSGIESILDELLAGKLSRDEAASRIRALTDIAPS